MSASPVSSGFPAMPVERPPDQPGAKCPRLSSMDCADFDLTGAEAEVRSTAKMYVKEQGELEVIKGVIVAVHSVSPTGFCWVETSDRRRAQVDGRCLGFNVMLNVALEAEAGTMVRDVIPKVACRFEQYLVADALRDGRTYPHLTLKYDFVADGAQLAQLLVVLRDFAARHSCVPLRL